MTAPQPRRIASPSRRSLAVASSGAARPELEADAADQPDRAVGGRRLDRPGHARHRRRDREGARPEDRHRQPARRLRLDRHQERARRAEGRLHLDRRRGAGPRHLPDARLLDTQASSDWDLFLNVANIQVIGVNPTTPYKNAEAADRRDEGQAGRDQRRDRRRQLGRPQRDGADRQGDRRQVQATSPTTAATRRSSPPSPARPR